MLQTTASFVAVTDVLRKTQAVHRAASVLLLYYSYDAQGSC